MAATLITRAQALAHLGLEDDEHVPGNLEDMMEAAEATVINYLKRPDHEWDLETVPREIRQAILLTLGAFDADRNGSAIDPLKPGGTVVNLVARYRRAAMA